jgi:hypothetical protein
MPVALPDTTTVMGSVPMAFDMSAPHRQQKHTTTYVMVNRLFHSTWPQ